MDDSEIHCHCTPDRLDVRCRIFSNGSKHYVMQCRVCGRQRGGAIGEKAAQSMLNGSTAQAFDPSLEEVHRAKRVAQIEQLVAVEQREIALKNPAAAQWLADKKELERAKSERVQALIDQCVLQLCTEIGEEQAANELGKNVVALRAKHREQLLLETLRFGSEEELKRWLESHLSEDFELFPEVPGQHISSCSPGPRH